MCEALGPGLLEEEEGEEERERIGGRGAFPGQRRSCDGHLTRC